jgi:hypothetical protein
VLGTFFFRKNVEKRRNVENFKAFLSAYLQISTCLKKNNELIIKAKYFYFIELQIYRLN